MLREQTGYLIEYCEDFAPVLAAYFHDLTAVKCKDITLFNVGFVEVLPAIKESDNTLRHTAHKHILLEQ